MDEIKELQSLTTPKGVYNSFPDQMARKELKAKLNAPGDVKDGDYLRVQSIGADGAVVLEGAEGTGTGSGQNVELDATLTQSGQAADAKAVGDALSNVQDKTAREAIGLIYNLLEKAVYTEDVSARLGQLKTLLENGSSGGDSGETEVTLVRVSATYSGGSVPVGTAVSALTGIKVTAHYSDGTSQNVTGYTLSGTIEEGNNTITVSYGGKTTTFTVMGVADEPDVPDVPESNVSQVGSTLSIVSGVTVSQSGSVLVIA